MVFIIHQINLLKVQLSLKFQVRQTGRLALDQKGYFKVNLFEYYLQIIHLVLAVEVDFLRKKMVNFEKSKKITHLKGYFPKVLLQAVQLSFMQISLVVFDFKLQVLQSNYFVNLVTVIRKGNLNQFVQINLQVVNLMFKQVLRTKRQAKPRQVIELLPQIKYYFGQAVAVQINLQMVIKKSSQQQVIY